jgi:hypothetical protein
LGTFWLKIEQFWPFEEIYIFSHGEKGGWNFKKIFSSETTVPISTKLCWNEPWVVLFQRKGTTQGSFQQSLVEIGTVVLEEKIFFNFIPLYELWTFAYFDRLCKLEKRGDEILKKSSPLKLLWEGTTQGSFQQSLVEIGSVVSEEKIFFNFIPPFF